MTALGREPRRLLAPLLELKVPDDPDRIWTRWLGGRERLGLSSASSSSSAPVKMVTLFLRFHNRFHFVLDVLVSVFSSCSESRCGFLDDL